MNAEVRQGDALDVLRGLPDRSVHAIVTDPPYCSGGASEAGRAAARCQGIRSGRERSGEVEWFAADNMGTAGLVWILRSVAFEAERLLVDGGSLVAFCDWRMWANLAPAMESGGLRLVNLLVWDKQSMGLGQGFRTRHELAIHLTNGVGIYHDKSTSNVLECGRVHVSDREHPTEKPIDLMRAIVRVVSPPGGLVVDPFCGSGSTGMACKREGRSFLGVERNPEYCEVARSRLRGESEQTELITESHHDTDTEDDA